MSGFPPIQIFLLCITFALLAIPLSHLTETRRRHATSQSAVAEVGAAHTSVPTLVRLRYEHQPVSLSLIQNGKELLGQIDLASSPAETRVSLQTVNEIAEMTLTATWPAATPDTALTVEVEPDALEARSETRWSSGAKINEVLTLRW